MKVPFDLTTTRSGIPEKDTDHYSSVSNYIFTKAGHTSYGAHSYTRSSRLLLVTLRRKLYIIIPITWTIIIVVLMNIYNAFNTSDDIITEEHVNTNFSTTSRRKKGLPYKGNPVLLHTAMGGTDAYVDDSNEDIDFPQLRRLVQHTSRGNVRPYGHPRRNYNTHQFSECYSYDGRTTDEPSMDTEGSRAFSATHNNNNNNNNNNKTNKNNVRRYPRYPNGPPGGHAVYYSNDRDVQEAFSPFVNWKANLASREKMGRCGSVDRKAQSDSTGVTGAASPLEQGRRRTLIPKIVDYTTLICSRHRGPSDGSTGTHDTGTHMHTVTTPFTPGMLSTMFGRSRISLVIDDPLSCSDETGYTYSASDTPNTEPMSHFIFNWCSSHLPQQKGVSNTYSGSDIPRTHSSNSEGTGTVPLDDGFLSCWTQWLEYEAPSWRVTRVILPTAPSSPEGSRRYIIAFRRRVRAFHFAITGGSDHRAAYVEHTWGMRTPLQWFGDEWTDTLRPIMPFHRMYNKDKFKFLTFKISRVWEIVYRDFSCIEGAEGDDDHALHSSNDIHQNDDFNQFYTSSTEFTKPFIRCLRPRGSVTTDTTSSSSTPRQAMDTLLNAYRDAAYDWYIRLWDDNYYFEENIYNTIGRLNPSMAVMAGKVTMLHMGKSNVRSERKRSLRGWGGYNDTTFPFMGGGAGWFLSHAGMSLAGPSFSRGGEDWLRMYENRRDIFLKHSLHNEDVFLTAWFGILNISMWNIPGVEHVSGGMGHKQRCITDEQHYRLRWMRPRDPTSPNVPSPPNNNNNNNSYTNTSTLPLGSGQGGAVLYYDYSPVSAFLLEHNISHSFTKPAVWHYMTPKRLVQLEGILYSNRIPYRRYEFHEALSGGGEGIYNSNNNNSNNNNNNMRYIPYIPRTTAADNIKRHKKHISCYSGVPNNNNNNGLPREGLSIFEYVMRDPAPEAVVL